MSSIFKHMKYLNLLLAFIFILFAYFQYNDPDPLLWIIAYSYVAVCILLYQYTDKSMIPISIGTLISLGVFFSYTPHIFNWFKDGMPSITGSMKAESPYIEMVRESLGILFILLVLGFYWIKLVKAKKN